jgi:hypothetical protein
MPLQKAAAWPKLLQYTPGNVPPDFDDRNMGHPNDQAVLLRLLERKEMARYGRNDVAKLMEHSYERTFFEMSLHMKAVHCEWAKSHPHTVQRCQSVLVQLYPFLPQYPEHDNGRCAKARAVLKHKSNQELQSGQI